MSNHVEDDIRTYAQMGMSAILPGMEYALEILKRQIEEIRASLAELEAVDEARRNGATKTPKRSRNWPASAAARKREMARRMEVTRQRKAEAEAEAEAASARINKGEKIRTAQKRTWAGMSPRQRKARLAAMAEGKKKKKHEAEAIAA